MNWKAKAGAASEVQEKNKGGSRLTLLLAAVLLALGLGGCASKELYVLRDQAMEEYRQENYARAEALFNEALSCGGGEVAETELEILRYRAECELRCREFDKARETYGILAQLDASEENQASYAELQQQFEKIGELNRAYALMQEEKYEEAYEINDGLAGLGGDAAAAAAWFNKAVCAEYMGRWEEAAELFGDYVSIYPDDTAAAKEYEFCRTR